MILGLLNKGHPKKKWNSSSFANPHEQAEIKQHDNIFIVLVVATDARQPSSKTKGRFTVLGSS